MTMKTLFWSELSASEKGSALKRPVKRVDAALTDVVSSILDDIEKRGATAVNYWSQKIDRAPAQLFELRSDSVDAARAQLSRDDLEALECAASNVATYHEATRPEDKVVDIGFGLECRRVYRPISSCGLYVPGGTAPLFSTMLMLALPAKAAGVDNRITVTPPPRVGAPNPAVIAAAALCGLNEIWLVGGAQAIGALAYGALLPRAEKIFGPGNAYVAEAKRQIAARGVAAIDLPAGPSELMVIADERASTATVAADLLGQAEHDADAQVLLTTPSADFAARVKRELSDQLALLPRRAIAAAALEQSKILIVRDIAEAARLANDYAPEHLALHVENADALASEISNAGAVFVGAASAEAFGDYVCGPSHVLPTDSAARVFSGVTTASFMKSLSIQRLTADGARALAPATARLARLEGLEAHALSAERRQ